MLRLDQKIAGWNAAYDALVLASRKGDPNGPQANNPRNQAVLAARHEERWPEYPCIDCAASRALEAALTAFVEG